MKAAADVSETVMTDTTYEFSPVELATELTVAWLGNPNTRVSAEDVPAFLQQMFATVKSLAAPSETGKVEAAEQPEFEPAVTARKSLASKDHIISMIDGKPYKTLRRHLSTHGLTPEKYRARYGLKPDYPMVSPNYSEARRAMAKQIGLGRKPGQTVKPTTDAAPAAAKKRGRPAKVAADS